MPKFPSSQDSTPHLTFTMHHDRWKDCRECSLCESRIRGKGKVVLAKGVLPCDVLFIGEAPGASENVLGRPFVGPAGKLLDRIIQEAFEDPEVVWPKSWAFTNLVACLPIPEGEKQKREPSQEAIDACRGRLMEFLKLARPSFIVCVGELAYKNISNMPMNDLFAEPRLRGDGRWLGQSRIAAGVTHIIHPAAILRSNVATQGIKIQEAVVTLRELVELPPF